FSRPLPRGGRCPRRAAVHGESVPGDSDLPRGAIDGSAGVRARASADPLATGLIALGYPLHPNFRPEVRDPPEWPMVVKPILFVQGDHDPFCDLARLREDLPRLPVPHDLVVIRHAGHSFEPKGPKRDTFLEVWDAVRRWMEERIPAP